MENKRKNWDYFSWYFQRLIWFDSWILCVNKVIIHTHSPQWMTFWQFSNFDFNTLPNNFLKDASLNPYKFAILVRYCHRLVFWRPLKKGYFLVKIIKIWHKCYFIHKKMVISFRNYAFLVLKLRSSTQNVENHKKQLCSNCFMLFYDLWSWHIFIPLRHDFDTSY